MLLLLQTKRRGHKIEPSNKRAVRDASRRSAPRASVRDKRQRAALNDDDDTLVRPSLICGDGPGDGHAVSQAVRQAGRRTGGRQTSRTERRGARRPSSRASDGQRRRRRAGGRTGEHTRRRANEQRRATTATSGGGGSDERRTAAGASATTHRGERDIRDKRRHRRRRRFDGGDDGAERRRPRRAFCSSLAASARPADGCGDSQPLLLGVLGRQLSSWSSRRQSGDRRQRGWPRALSNAARDRVNLADRRLHDARRRSSSSSTTTRVATRTATSRMLPQHEHSLLQQHQSNHQLVMTR